MSHSLTNLKASHYKSAFRILYSLFDKISYFLHRFLELNVIEDDNRITFDRLFREINKTKSWVPHPRLKESKNQFLHALFYILKDIRDVQDSTPISQWLDPDAKSFAEIRNALEHRSLKIVDDFGYTLTQSDKAYTSEQLKKYIEEKELCIQELQELYQQGKSLKNSGDLTEGVILNERKIKLNSRVSEIDSLIDEQKRLSTHSLLITVSEFESRTLTLMRLARNSIMYLSLAIHFEEIRKPKKDGFVMPTDVPLK